MSTHFQVLEWIRKLGYDGEVPENLDKICNHSTSFIWDQLIQNARSKIEVDNMRKNILVHYIKKNGLNLNKADTSQYAVEEIITYLKKSNLEKSLLNVNYQITEKQNVNQNLIHQNKKKRFSIEKINLKIKENEEREFLFQEKLKLLQKDLEDGETILKFSIDSNLANSAAIINSKEITQTLQKCEEELEDKVKQLPLPNISSNDSINRLMVSAQKSTRSNIFEQYLSLTEKRTAEKINRPQNKENIGPNKINVRLFPDDDRVKTYSETVDIFDGRKSLEMNIEDNDDENFLVSLSEGSFLAPLLRSKYTRHSPLSMIQEREQSFFLNKTEHFSNHRESCESLLNGIYKDCVMKDIARLLLQYNHQNIWNAFCTLDENIHFNISKKINFRDVKCSSTKNRRLEDLTRLRTLHVKTEFKIVHNNIVIKQLTEKVNEKKTSINISLANAGYPEDLIDSLHRNLELQLEDVGLDCLLGEIKKEINILNSSKVMDISEIKKRLMEIKEEIALKRNSLIQYLEIVQEIFLIINRIRNTTSSCVRKLAPFTSDLSWSCLLPETINFNEIKAFEDFPLENNRKFIHADPSMYYRDIHTTKFLCNREIDNANLDILCNILDSPFSTPESIILNILRQKLKLEALQLIKPVATKVQFKKYSLKELQAQENYIVNALEQLNAIIASSTSKKTLSAGDVTKKIMEMWIEMPFTDIISSNRIVDGKDYATCEKMFDRFYNDL